MALSRLLMCLATVSLLLLTQWGTADTMDARKETIKALGQALDDYAFENEGKLPGKLSELYYGSYVRDLSLFVLPGSETALKDRTQIDTQTAYEIVADRFDPETATPVLREKERNGLDHPLEFLSNGKVRVTGETEPEPLPVPLEPQPIVQPPPTPPQRPQIPVHENTLAKNPLESTRTPIDKPEILPGGRRFRSDEHSFEMAILEGWSVIPPADPSSAAEMLGPPETGASLSIYVSGSIAPSPKTSWDKFLEDWSPWALRRYMNYHVLEYDTGELDGQAICLAKATSDGLRHLEYFVAGSKHLYHISIFCPSETWPTTLPSLIKITETFRTL